MGEIYSDLMVNITYRTSREQKTQITNAWESLLSKYKKKGICDKHGGRFKDDEIRFRIGAEKITSKGPNYTAQYHMLGEFIMELMIILNEWDLDFNIQTSGITD